MTPSARYPGGWGGPLRLRQLKANIQVSLHCAPDNDQSGQDEFTDAGSHLRPETQSVPREPKTAWERPAGRSAVWAAAGWNPPPHSAAVNNHFNGLFLAVIFGSRRCFDGPGWGRVDSTQQLPVRLMRTDRLFRQTQDRKINMEANSTCQILINGLPVGIYSAIGMHTEWPILFPVISTAHHRPNE